MATNTFGVICFQRGWKGNELNPELDLYLALSGLCVCSCMFACTQARLSESSATLKRDLYHNLTSVVHSRPRGPCACQAGPLKHSLVWKLWGLKKNETRV